MSTALIIVEDGERKDSDEEDRECDEQASHLLEEAERSPQESIRAVGSV